VATLTVWSDAADGYVTSSNSSYSSARAGSNLASATGGSTEQMIWSGASGTETIRQLFFGFDTSTLGDDDFISDVALALWPTAQTSNDTVSQLIYARLYNWDTTVTTADWRATDGTSATDTLLASKAKTTTKGVNSLTTGQYNTLTSDAAFKSNVSKTGFTRLYTLISNAESDNDTPASGNTVTVYMGDQTGTDNDPKLTVTYTPRVKTRLYLPISGTPSISPSYASGWEKTSDADTNGRIKAVTAKSSTTLTNYSASENTSTTPYDVLIRQYIFGPLATSVDFTNGELKGFIRATESNAAADMRAQIVVRAIQSDGTTVRNTPLDFDTGALAEEFNPSGSGGSTSRAFPRTTGQLLAAVSASAGDYLAIEIGYRSHNAVGTSYSGTLRLGDTGSTDFTAADQSNDYVPWLDFITGSALVLVEATSSTDDLSVNLTEGTSAVAIYATDIENTPVNIQDNVSEVLIRATDVEDVSVNVTHTESIAIVATDIEDLPVNVSEGDSLDTGAETVSKSEALNLVLNVSETEAILSSDYLTDTDDLSVNVDETSPLISYEAFSDTDDLPLDIEETDEVVVVFLALTDTENLSANATEAQSILKSNEFFTSTASLAVNSSEEQDVVEYLSLSSTDNLSVNVSHDELVIKLKDFLSSTDNLAVNASEVSALLVRLALTSTDNLSVNATHSESAKELLGHVVDRVASGKAKVRSAPSGRPTLRDSISGGRNEH
jgi:hypothetical protein